MTSNLILSVESQDIHDSLKPEITKNDELKINLDYLTYLPQNDYIIGPGDVLKIIVSRDYPELTTISVIDIEGTINLPKINRIFVSGLTLSELNKLLNKKFFEIVKYPLVETSLLDYRPAKIIINGEVANPGMQTLRGSFQPLRGSFQTSSRDIENKLLPPVNTDSLSLLGGDSPAKAPLDVSRPEDFFDSYSKVRRQNDDFVFPTVFDAIRSAGGLTRLSDLKNVEIVRKDTLSNGGGFKKTTINFEKVFYGDTSSNIRVYDGDSITIGKLNNPNEKILTLAAASVLNPKTINVYVSGRVLEPGNLVVPTQSSLLDAINFAGGAKGIKGPITFVRFTNDGLLEKRIFRMRKNAKRGSYQEILIYKIRILFS